MSAIVGMAKALSLSVVAEGVENVGQARRASELGCDLAQGFYFGRPVPAQVLLTRLYRELRCAEADRRGAVGALSGSPPPRKPRPPSPAPPRGRHDPVLDNDARARRARERSG